MKNWISPAIARDRIASAQVTPEAGRTTKPRKYQISAATGSRVTTVYNSR